MLSHRCTPPSVCTESCTCPIGSLCEPLVASRHSPCGRGIIQPAHKMARIRRRHQGMLAYSYFFVFLVRVPTAAIFMFCGQFSKSTASYPFMWSRSSLWLISLMLFWVGVSGHSCTSWFLQVILRRIVSYLSHIELCVCRTVPSRFTSAA